MLVKYVKIISLSISHLPLRFMILLVVKTLKDFIRLNLTYFLLFFLSNLGSPLSSQELQIYPQPRYFYIFKFSHVLLFYLSDIYLCKVLTKGLILLFIYHKLFNWILYFIPIDWKFRIYHKTVPIYTICFQAFHSVYDLHTYSYTKITLL